MGRRGPHDARANGEAQDSDARATARGRAPLDPPFEQAPLGIAVLDDGGVVEAWNQRAEAITGWPASRAVGKPLSAIIAHSARRGEIEVPGPLHPRQVVRLWFGAAAATRHACFFDDVTARRRREEQGVQARKLEALGLLAGGIAHEVNNALVGVLGSLSLAKAELPSDATALRHLERVENAGALCAGFCRQLLGYAGRGARVKEPSHLGEIVRDLVPTLDACLPPRGVLECQVEPDVPALLGDPKQLAQVVVHLVNNAAQALVEGTGRVSVSVGKASGTATALERLYPGSDLPGGDYVSLTVSDTGAGMPAEVARRAFDPFFTTRGGGKGLGLATVAGAVRSHGGEMHLDSQPGRGTTLTALFPTGGESGTTPPQVAPPRDKPSDPSSRSSAARRGVILLVDDQAAVRSTVRRLLEREGYLVMTADGGRRALELYARHRREIALVLLDMGMPDLDGVATLIELRRLEPRVRVLVISGQGEREIARRLGVVDRVPFVSKPFEVEELLDAVALELGS